MTTRVPLIPNEALSGVLGSVSLASWIFLLLPQLYENYTQHSAAGISVQFLLIWFIGDILNLAGAAWGGLIPTVIALAAYFCLSDTVLILQCLYYNLWVSRRSRSPESVGSNNQASLGRNAEDSSGTTEGTLNDTRDDEPLLSRTDSVSYRSIGSSNVGLPGSNRRRKSSAASGLGKLIEEEGEPGTMQGWLKNTISIVAVCAIGSAGWVCEPISIRPWVRPG